MWRALWRSIDRFSLQHFKYLINELRQIKAVDKFNKELVIDLLQSVVEIVTYGDRHDPAIFECFMEYQVLGEFVRILQNSRHSSIEAPLLQYLSIMIQNIESEQAIYYCLSNGYVNSIITHPYQFDIGDLAPYYISFLRAVSSELNRDILCLLVKVQEDAVTSFPLYSEALKFAHHGETMIQTAIRALTLNIYKVSDDTVFQFVTTPPASVYFSDLVLSIKKKLVNLDNHIQAIRDSCPNERMRENLIEANEIVVDLYYLDDVIRVGNPRLSKLIISNLVSLMLLPMLISLLQLGRNDGAFLSGVTSLVVIARLLQIVQDKYLVNFVVSAILFADISFENRNASERVTNGGASYESKQADHFKRNYLLEHLSGYFSSDSSFASFDFEDMLEERMGIMSHILSDDKRIALASLMLLLVVSEAKGLHSQLAGIMGFCQTQTHILKRDNSSESQVVDYRNFARHLPQILHELLMILASQLPYCVSMQWQTGWFLRKLLVFQVYKLDGEDVHVFNMSYKRSCEHLLSEIRGCWFDHIPDTLAKEWASCKSVLEESSQSKDPFFALELSHCQRACSNKNCGGNLSTMAWRRMVDIVKVLNMVHRIFHSTLFLKKQNFLCLFNFQVFVLHIHLKALIFNSNPFENLILNLKSNSFTVSGKKYVSDLHSASFGSEVSLAPGIPCKIAFSKVETRDIYIIPVAMGIFGKLLLLEKHPLHSKRGLVIAIAPLAGLNPKIEENHPTWLRLQIRELKPRFGEIKTKSHNSITPNHEQDGRWTLGFSDSKACDDALLFIIEETNKQRSFVENLITPLLASRPSILTESGETQELNYEVSE